MRRTSVTGGAIATLFLLGLSVGLVSSAWAGPWEDGMAAYNRGDYVPAIPLFRPFAEQGNPKPQDLFGVMYRRG